MRSSQRPHLLHLILTLWFSTVLCTPSLAGDIALLSIGPRIGFSGKTPLLGKEQKYFFHMTDVAAVFKLPWSWPLGGNSWSLETRLIASAGLLQAASDSGLIMTVVPDLALSGWEGLVTFDAGAGAGFFSNYKFGAQDFGARFKSSRLWGFASIHFLTPMPDFVSNTSPMPACTDRPVSAWTCTSQNLDTGFNPEVAGLAIPSHAINQAPPCRPMASTLTTHNAAQSAA